MNKLTVIDTFATGSFHEMFNASFLLSSSYVFDEIEYIGTKSSINNQKKILSEYNIDNVKYYYVNQLEKAGVLWLVIKYLWAAINCFFKIRRANGNIIVLNNNPFLTPFFCLIKKNVSIICHGELELLGETKQGLFARIQSALLKKAFKKRTLSEKLSFVVLGDIIIKNLNNVLPPENIKRFKSIDHPYIFNYSSIDSITPLSNDCINIGIACVTNPSKGQGLLLNLLDGLSNPNINIYHIGKIFDHKNILKSKGLIIVKRGTNNELSRDHYLEWVSKMDLLLYLYPTDNYKMTASGAIFEAFSNLKPIIGLHNDYFDYILQKVGTIGYLYNTVEDIVDCMNNLKKCEIMKPTSILERRIIFSPEIVKNQIKQLFDFS